MGDFGNLHKDLEGKVKSTKWDFDDILASINDSKGNMDREFDEE